MILYLGMWYALLQPMDCCRVVHTCKDNPHHIICITVVSILTTIVILTINIIIHVKAILGPGRWWSSRCTLRGRQSVGRSWAAEKQSSSYLLFNQHHPSEICTFDWGKVLDCSGSQLPQSVAWIITSEGGLAVVPLFILVAFCAMHTRQLFHNCLLAAAASPYPSHSFSFRRVYC